MKKIGNIVAPVLFVFSLVSCGEDNNVASVVFNDGYQEEWKVGEIDFSAFSYTVTYKNGVVEKVPVDVSMVDKNDLYKFYKPGEWQVKFNFNNQFGTLVDFTIYENTFDDSIKLEDEVVVYDGQSHGLTLVGPIPEGTKVFYSTGNSFIDYSVEPYEVKCIISKAGYKTKTLEGNLTITQSEYSKDVLDSIVFEDAEFTYDGTEKKIEAKNIPSDLNIEYFIDKNRGNSRVNAGTYKVIGVFSCSNFNYKPINNIEANLVIKKAKYDLDSLGISFDDKTTTYQSGFQQTIILTNEDRLPTSVSVIYENNKHEEAGSYEAKASFIVDDNYEPIPFMTATLNIAPAIVDLSQVKITKPQLVTFNGETQSFEIEAPELVEVTKTYYDEAGAVVENPVNVGTYRVKLDYSTIGASTNYNLINTPTEDGVLIIQKKILDLGNLDFGNQKYTYDGEEKSFNVEIDNQIPDELTITTSYSKDDLPVSNPINVGTYSVDFDVAFKEIDSTGHEIHAENYQILNAPTHEGTLCIEKIKIDLSNVLIRNQVGEYVGDDTTNILYQVNNVPQEAKYSVIYYKNGTETTNTTQVGTYSVYVSFELKDNYSSENYELVNIPNGSANLTVQKKRIVLDDIVVEDCTVTETGEEISFPVSSITNFDNISQYVNVVCIYYENGTKLADGSLPTDPGDYSVEISFVLKDEYTEDKYVIWSSAPMEFYAIMHIVEQ